MLNLMNIRISMLKKFFIIVLGALSTNLWAVETKVDTITVKTTGASSSSAVEWTYTGASTITYAGKSAKVDGKDQIQITGKQNKGNGIVSTNSLKDYYLREVRIAWADATYSADRNMIIFGNTKQFTIADLFNSTVISNNAIDTIGTGSNEGKHTSIATITHNYPYMGLRIQKDAAYIDTIYLVWDKKTEDGDEVTLQSISLDKDTLFMETEDEEQLTVSYLPTNATYKGVTWTSCNNNIATVTNGTVQAVSPGGTYIVATSTDGQELTDTCYVGVRKKDIFKGLELYNKITDIDSLHNGDSIILVYEKGKVGSSKFEEYEIKGTPAGRLTASVGWKAQSGDTIGFSPTTIEDLHLYKTEQGWQIKVIVWEPDEYDTEFFKPVEYLLRANATNKLKIKGEGTTFWNISFTETGDANITNKNADAGSIRYNNGFTTYGSKSQVEAIQIYRKLGQFTDTTTFVPPIVIDDEEEEQGDEEKDDDEEQEDEEQEEKTDDEEQEEDKPIEDGIKDIYKPQEGTRYNLLGIPVSDQYKGIVIRNGEMYLQ